MNGTTGDDDDSFHVGIVEEKCLFNFKFHAFRWKYVAVLPFFLCLRGNIALPSTSWAQILIYISIYKLFGFGISRTWLRREWASLGRPMNYELPWSDCQLLLCAILHLHHVAFSFFPYFARLVKPRKSLLLPPPTGSSLVSTFFHLSSYVLCSSHISFLDIDLARSRKYILCCVCGTIHSKMWYDQGLLILFSVFFLNMKEILVKFHIKLNFSFMPALLQLGWSFFCCRACKDSFALRELEKSSQIPLANLYSFSADPLRSHRNTWSNFLVVHQERDIHEKFSRHRGGRKEVSRFVGRRAKKKTRQCRMRSTFITLRENWVERKVDIKAKNGIMGIGGREKRWAQLWSDVYVSCVQAEDPVAD